MFGSHISPTRNQTIIIQCSPCKPKAVDGVDDIPSPYSPIISAGTAPLHPGNSYNTHFILRPHHFEEQKYSNGDEVVCPSVRVEDGLKKRAQGEALTNSERE